MPNKEIYTDNIEIRQRLNARTPGKWAIGFSDGSGKFDKSSCGAYIIADQTDVVVCGGDYEGIPIGVLKSEDADFIAHAPDDMRRLLERGDALKGMFDVALQILTSLNYSELSEEFQQEIYKKVCLMEKIMLEFKEKYENETPQQTN